MPGSMLSSKTSMAEAAAAKETSEKAERALARALAVGIPASTVVLALVTTGLAGLGPALLVLAGGALLGTIALFWASLRTLGGDAPLSEGLVNATVRQVTQADRTAERKREVLRALKDLEFEHAVGKIDDRDYSALSAKLRDEAKSLMRAMDVDVEPLRGRAEEIVREHLAKRNLRTDFPEPERPPRAVKAKDPVGSDTMKSRHEKPKASQRVSCAECGASNEADSRFCKGCGSSLEEAEDAPA